MYIILDRLYRWSCHLWRRNICLQKKVMIFPIETYDYYDILLGVLGLSQQVPLCTSKGDACEASAVFYSLAATAAANGISAEQYFTKLLSYPTKILLPWNWCSPISAAFGAALFFWKRGIIERLRFSGLHNSQNSDNANKIFALSCKIHQDML